MLFLCSPCCRPGSDPINQSRGTASESAPHQQPRRRHRPFARRHRRASRGQDRPAQAGCRPAQAAVPGQGGREGRGRRDGAQPPRAVHRRRRRFAPADEGQARRPWRAQLPLQPELARDPGIRRGRGGQRGQRRQRAHSVRQPDFRPRPGHRLGHAAPEQGAGPGRRQARRARQQHLRHADPARIRRPGGVRRRQGSRPPGLCGELLRRWRGAPDAPGRDRRRQQRSHPQAVGQPAACAGRHRPGRQCQDRPVRVRHRLRLPGRGAERQHLHHEQHQREDGQPQPLHDQYQHHRVLLHLPAQHGEDH